MHGKDIPIPKGRNTKEGRETGPYQVQDLSRQISLDVKAQESSYLSWFSAFQAHWAGNISLTPLQGSPAHLALGNCPCLQGPLLNLHLLKLRRIQPWAMCLRWEWQPWGSQNCLSHWIFHFFFFFLEEYTLSKSNRLMALLQILLVEPNKLNMLACFIPSWFLP